MFWSTGDFLSASAGASWSASVFLSAKTGVFLSAYGASALLIPFCIL